MAFPQNRVESITQLTRGYRPVVHRGRFHKSFIRNDLRLFLIQDFHVPSF